jgi:hypothetical protein
MVSSQTTCYYYSDLIHSLLSWLVNNFNVREFSYIIFYHKQFYFLEDFRNLIHTFLV